MDPRETIEEFLSHKRIAFVGLSAHEGDFSRAVLHELLAHGYDVVPVHTRALEIEGRRAFARVQQISPPVDGVLVMTPPEATTDVVRDCIEANVRRIWLHRGVGGRGSVTTEAVDLCGANDIAVVDGQCPLMFLDGAASVHRVHAGAKRIAGTYPSSASGGSLVALLGHAVLGWVVCAALMAMLLRTTTLSVALGVHVVAAPIVFALLAAAYFRTYGGRPFTVAMVFAGTTIVLDALLVALLVQHSFAMFASPLGTWIPFALIYLATLVTGGVVEPRRDRATHGTPHASH